nr:unnamed protein product [Callosobruchus analis]
MAARKLLSPGLSTTSAMTRFEIAKSIIFQEQEEQEVGGLDDDNASDGSICDSNHASESEQDGVDFDDLEYEETNTLEPSIRHACFVGKDKSTVWHKHPVKSRFSKHAQKNVVKIFPRPSQNHREVTAPDTVFQNFRMIEMVDEIVSCANVYIRFGRN